MWKSQDFKISFNYFYEGETKTMYYEDIFHDTKTHGAVRLFRYGLNGEQETVTHIPIRSKQLNKNSRNHDGIAYTVLTNPRSDKEVNMEVGR